MNISPHEIQVLFVRWLLFPYLNKIFIIDLCKSYFFDKFYAIAATE